MTENLPLLKKLRVETADLHEALHVHPLLAPLHTGDINQSQYRAVLRAFHVAYSVMEGARRLKDAPFMETDSLSLLREDMKRHGVHAASIQMDYPAIDTLSKLVGYLYVKEGSALGGQVISKHLKRELGLEPGTDNRFFAGRGKETAAHWRQFLADLNEVEDQVDAGEAVAQALASFRMVATACDRIAGRLQAA